MMKGTGHKVWSDEGVSIHYFDSLTSTNDTAREGKYGQWDVVVAKEQTAGRGQRGNTWSSNPGDNLTFSLVLEPRFLPADRQFLLSEAVALAVVRMLELNGIVAQVKWPNDIYVGDRKIAGILIENDIMGASLSRSIVGVGINVNQVAFGSDIPNPVSMRMLSRKVYYLPEILGRFLNEFALLHEELKDERKGYLQSEYYSKLYKADEPHLFTIPGEGSQAPVKKEGVIRKVEPSGELTVEFPDGRRSFLFKEIEF